MRMHSRTLKSVSVLLLSLICLETFAIAAPRRRGGNQGSARGGARSGQKGTKVQVNSQTIAACNANLTQAGIALPPGARITSITVHADEWVCTSCNASNAGLSNSSGRSRPQCTNCGSGREAHENEAYKTPVTVDRESLSEEAALESLLQGVDWSCTYCNVSNRHSIRGKIINACQNCSGPREGSAQEAQDLQGRSASRTDTVTEALLDHSERRESSASLSPVPRSIEDLRQMVIRNRNGIMIGAGLIALIGVLIDGFSDHPLTARITNARWIRTVRVEVFQAVIKRAMRSEIPAERAPVMPVNGQGEVAGIRILDCTGDSCLYETYEWVPRDSVERRGNYGETPPAGSDWARLQVPSDGRIMENTRYDVDFEFRSMGLDRAPDWRPHSYNEFMQFAPGSEIEITLDPLQNVQSARRVRSSN